MCLGVPGKVTDVFEEDGIRMGTVDFGGITRSAALSSPSEVSVSAWGRVERARAFLPTGEAGARASVRAKRGSRAPRTGPGRYA